MSPLFLGSFLPTRNFLIQSLTPRYGAGLSVPLQMGFHFWPFRKGDGFDVSQSHELKNDCQSEDCERVFSSCCRACQITPAEEPHPRLEKLRIVFHCFH